MHPSASSASPSKRATAAASLGVEAPAGGTLPSASRAKSSRPSAELRLSHEPRPPHDGLVLGAGQRDVGEAQVLAALLGLVLAAVGGEVGAVQADVDDALVAAPAGRGRRPAGRSSGMQPGSHR